MHRTTSRHDLRDLLDTVGPRVESAIQTVAEKAPPAIEHGRAVAAEHGSHLAEVLADRLPDSVVDRLPDRVVDHLPVSRHRRGRKLLLVGLAAAVAGAVVAARRARGSSAGVHRDATTSTPSTPAGPGNSTTPDPLVETQANNRRD